MDSRPACTACADAGDAGDEVDVSAFEQELEAALLGSDDDGEAGEFGSADDEVGAPAATPAAAAAAAATARPLPSRNAALAFNVAAEAILAFSHVSETKVSFVNRVWWLTFQRRIRASARGLLQAWLPRNVAFAVEGEVLTRCGGYAGPGAYNAKIRSLVVNLSRNPDLRTGVTSGAIPPGRFVTMHPQEMLRAAEAAEVERLRREHLLAARREVAADSVGFFACECGCVKQVRRRRMRGGTADTSRVTEVLICVDCGAAVDVNRGYARRKAQEERAAAEAAAAAAAAAAGAASNAAAAPASDAAAAVAAGERTGGAAAAQGTLSASQRKQQDEELEELEALFVAVAAREAEEEEKRRAERAAAAEAALLGSRSQSSASTPGAASGGGGGAGYDDGTAAAPASAGVWGFGSAPLREPSSALSS